MDITRPKRINTVAPHDQRTVIVTAFPDARSFNPLSAIPRKTRRFDLPVAEVNLQNPVTGPPLLIERTHQSVALGMNVRRHLVVRGFLMREEYRFPISNARLTSSRSLCFFGSEPGTKVRPKSASHPSNTGRAASWIEPQASLGGKARLTCSGSSVSTRPAYGIGLSPSPFCFPGPDYSGE